MSNQLSNMTEQQEKRVMDQFECYPLAYCWFNQLV